jgi:hypothetical protein
MLPLSKPFICVLIIIVSIVLSNVIETFDNLDTYWKSWGTHNSTSGVSTSQSQSQSQSPSLSCNVPACEADITNYINKGWAYTSSNFSSCANCPVVSYPNHLPTSASTTPVPVPAPSSTCNVSACEADITNYINKGWAYTSSSFGSCANCPVVSYPNHLPVSASTSTGTMSS